MAARAAPDGYTLLLAGSHFTINPGLSAKRPYDPVRSFTPICGIARSPHVIAVTPGLPVTTVDDLIALLKVRPGKHSFASPGIGTTGHLIGERFRIALDADLQHIPFNSAGQAVTAAIGGHVPILVTPLSAAIGAIQDGKLRALAVPSGRRAFTLPDIPTLSEIGIAGQDSDLTQGLVGPASMPPAIVEMLSDAIAQILDLAETRDRLVAAGFEPMKMTSQEYARLIETELNGWSAIIRSANIGLRY